MLVSKIESPPFLLCKIYNSKARPPLWSGCLVFQVSDGHGLEYMDDVWLIFYIHHAYMENLKVFLHKSQTPCKIGFQRA